MDLSNTIVDHLHGDVLQFNIISRLFAIDLRPASLVSKAWREAVVAWLRRRRCRPPPSLFILFQSRYDLGKLSSVAFDPLSLSWNLVPLAKNGSVPISAARTSYGARLCSLSASKLALSEDPFGASWRELKAPRYWWRTEPVVAVVGNYVVVAGGVNEYEDAPLNAVEILDVNDSAWETCEPMPEVFGWTSCLSVAVTEQRIFVIEKQSPWSASWFDPKAKCWSTPTQLGLNEKQPGVKFAAIGILSGRLIVVGVSGKETGESFRPESVRFWAVNEETMQVTDEKEAWRMPPDMVAGLAVEDGDGGWCEMRSIGFLTDGMFGYVYNPSQPLEFFLCEFRCGEDDDGGVDECRWERVALPASLTEKLCLSRVVIGCSTSTVSAATSKGLFNGC